MTELTQKGLKRYILEILLAEPKQHKFNIIGKTHQPGMLERRTGAAFSAQNRAAAAGAFDELKRDGFIQSTFSDLIDPENWVAITPAGRSFLERNMRDSIDQGLEAIGANLIELRQGMHDAVQRSSPDAARQAAHSARELLDQLLKEGAPKELATRRERFRHMMQAGRKSAEFSQTDLALIDANWKVVEAELNKLLGASHSREIPPRHEVASSISAIERILRLISPDAGA